MKKLLLSSFLLVSLNLLSQVNTDEYINAKYVQFFEWDKIEKNYVLDYGDWMNTTLSPYDDYYLFEIDNDGDVDKVWWEYEEEEYEFDSASYYTEDGRKIIFNFDSQEIWVYHDYYKREDRYYKLMILSKLETFEK